MHWWITKQLKSKKVDARLKAVERLAEEDSEAAWRAVSSMIQDPAPEIRSRVFQLLARCDALDFLEGFVRGMKDPVDEVRIAAAEGLARSRDRSAIPHLIQALEDSSDSVRWRAASGLDAIGWSTSDDRLKILQQVALGKLHKAASYGPEAISPLMTVLKGGVYYKRQEAVEAISSIDDPRVVPPLISALQDEESLVRVAAVSALSQIGDARAVEPLIRALKDKDSSVRSCAVEAVSQLGDARALEPLAQLARDSDSEVRVAAIKGLARFTDARTLPPLMTATQDKEKAVREAAVFALGKLGDNRAIECLVVCLADSYDRIRKLSESILKRLDPYWIRSEAARAAIPQLQKLSKSHDYWVKQSATEILNRFSFEAGEIDPNAPDAPASFVNPVQQKRSTALRALCQALQNPDRDLRQAGAIGLMKMGDLAALEALPSSLGDNDHWVQAATARALESMEWQPKEGGLKARYLALLDRWEELPALGHAAVRPLMEAIEHPSPKKREAALRCLGELADPSTFEPIARCLEDSSPKVRKTAAEALKRMHHVPQERVHQEVYFTLTEDWAALARLGTSALPALIQAIRTREDQPDSGMRAEQALSGLSDPATLPALLRHVHDMHASRAVLAALINILERFPEEIAQPELQLLTALPPMQCMAFEFDVDRKTYTPMGLQALDTRWLEDLARQELERRRIAACAP